MTPLLRAQQVKNEQGSCYLIYEIFAAKTYFALVNTVNFI